MEKEENDHDDQCDREHELALHIVHRGTNGGGPIGRHRQRDGRRQGILQPRQQFLDPVHHFDHIGAGLALNIDQHGRCLAEPGGLPVVFDVADHMRNLMEADGRAAAVGHHHLRKLFGAQQLIIGIDGIGAIRSIEASFRLIHVIGTDGGTEILETQVIGRERTRIGLDADGGALPSTEPDKAHAADLGKLLGQAGVSQILDFRQRQVW